MAWVDWQQLESAYGSGYESLIRCGAGGSIGYLQAPWRAQYARGQCGGKGSCMGYHTHSATLAALGSGLAARGRKPCLVLINQDWGHRNNSGCNGASSIATYRVAAAPPARVSRSPQGAEWLGAGGSEAGERGGGRGERRDHKRKENEKG